MARAHAALSFQHTPNRTTASPFASLYHAPNFIEAVGTERYDLPARFSVPATHFRLAHVLRQGGS